MKTDIHPEYVECRVTCSCGNQFVTRATVPELRVELCSACHPFYTGKQKLVDTGGRVERFEKRYAKASQTEPDESAEETKRARRKKRTSDAPRRKPPVATKGGPRPKFEKPQKGDGDRGDRGGRRDDSGRQKAKQAEPRPEPESEPPEQTEGASTETGSEEPSSES